MTISRRGLLESGCLAVGTLAGCTGGKSPETIEFTDGLEEGFMGWTRDSDVPEDPNNHGNPVAWMITHSTERATDGTASLRYYLDGTQDDGTIWIVQPITVDSGHTYNMRMQVDAWSASESFNTLAHLVMYAGPSRPTSEGSFPSPGTSSSDAGVTDTGGLREPLNQVEGWQTYSFSWKTPTLQMDAIYIATGISAVWETEMTYFIDNITLTATPR